MYKVGTISARKLNTSLKKHLLWSLASTWWRLLRCSDRRIVLLLLTSATRSCEHHAREHLLHVASRTGILAARRVVRRSSHLLHVALFDVATTRNSAISEILAACTGMDTQAVSSTRSVMKCKARRKYVMSCRKHVQKLRTYCVMKSSKTAQIVLWKAVKKQMLC